MKNVEACLKKYKQEALLKYIESAPANVRESLVAQLLKVDFEVFFPMMAGVESSVDFDSSSLSGLEPHPVISFNEVRSASHESIGSKAFSRGEVAFFVVAGGQGSRLGFEHPKGMFPASPFGRSLFQIHFEKVKECGCRFGFSPHFLVMTSETNHSETQEYLRAQNYFGLLKENVHVFQQGTLPAIDFDGNLILAEKDRLFLAPDGHGGSLAAIRKHGLIKVLHAAGVKYLSYFQVDNPLVNMCDTSFFGAHISSGSEMSSKVLKKRDPLEKLGNAVSRAGVSCVVEYSDLAEHLARRRTESGDLVFAFGSIGIHSFNLSFIERVTEDGHQLPFHKATKKIPIFNVKSQAFETPVAANGKKYEQFVFDAIPLAHKTIFAETLREEEFAPVKNRDGEDSVASSKELQSAFFRGWFQHAGYDVRNVGKVEVAPSFALSEREFTQKIKQFLKAVPKDIFLG